MTMCLCFDLRIVETHSLAQLCERHVVVDTDEDDDVDCDVDCDEQIFDTTVSSIGYKYSSPSKHVSICMH